MILGKSNLNICNFCETRNVVLMRFSSFLFFSFFQFFDKMVSKMVSKNHAHIERGGRKLLNVSNNGVGELHLYFNIISNKKPRS